MSTLNRRQALRNLSLGAGGALLTPFLDQLRAQASGEAAALPKRVVFVLESNGCNPDQVQPTSIKRVAPNGRSSAGKLTDLPMTKQDLPPALEPLAEFKDRLTVVQGLSGRVCGGGHSNNFGALGCYSGKKGPMGETVDAALARALPGTFPHVGLGIVNSKEPTVVYSTSAWAPGQAMPVLCRPDLAFNGLFGSVAGGDGKKMFQARGRLLDFLRDDVKRVEAEVAGPEREKLDAYLGALDSLRQRQSRLNAIEPTLRKQAPAPDDKYKSDVETDRLDAHFDLAAAALIAGLTNVVTLTSGCGDPYFSVTFKGLGINITKHGIGHGGGENGKTSAELSTIIRKFHMGLIARLAKKLQAVPEGNGTMLDNTLIVYLSDGAEGHHSRCWEWPFVLLGNLGGKLKAGRFLEYPTHGRTGHRTTANLYCTLLHAAGAPRDKFGMLDPELKEADQRGPLSELLA